MRNSIGYFLLRDKVLLATDQKITASKSCNRIKFYNN